MIGTRIVSVAAALGIALASAACGDDTPSRDEIAARIRADPQMAGASDRTVDCIADWYEDYATDEQRSAFRAGGPIVAASAGPAGSKAEAAMIECIKLAT